MEAVLRSLSSAEVSPMEEFGSGLSGASVESLPKTFLERLGARGLEVSETEMSWRSVCLLRPSRWRWLRKSGSTPLDNPRYVLFQEMEGGEWGRTRVYRTAFTPSQFYGALTKAIARDEDGRAAKTEDGGLSWKDEKGEAVKPDPKKFKIETR